MSRGSNKTSEFVNRAEEFVDQVLKHSKNYLPHVARLCLVTTYLEDSLRMWIHAESHRQYYNDSWSCGTTLAAVLLLVIQLCELIPCILILLRKHVNVAVYILFVDIILQIVVYQMIHNYHHLMRFISLMGGLMLLLVENKPDARSLFTGVPSLDNNTSKNIMQLTGRLLVVLMFLTLVRLDLTFMHMFLIAIGSLFIFLVTIGYKTKLSAFTLSAILLVENFITNQFWAYEFNDPLHDFYKFDFFQTISLIGGLLFVVALGPGGVSMDNYKKKW